MWTFLCLLRHGKLFSITSLHTVLCNYYTTVLWTGSKSYLTFSWRQTWLKIPIFLLVAFKRLHLLLSAYISCIPYVYREVGRSVVVCKVLSKRKYFKCAYENIAKEWWTISSLNCSLSKMVVLHKYLSDCVSLSKMNSVTWVYSFWPNKLQITSAVTSVF